MIRSILKSFLSPASATHNRRRVKGGGVHSGLERLESRALLTGNINVMLAGSTALIFGDSGNNSLEVAEDGGNIVARGLNGTTINGGTDAFTIATGTTTFSGQFLAWLGRGNDTLTVGSGLSFSQSLFVDGQGGNDTIGILADSVGRDLNLNGGFGTDSISIQGTSVGGNIYVWSQDSATIDISGVNVAHQLHVNTGSGDDSVVVRNTTVADLTFISTGSKHDSIAINNSTLNGPLLIFAGTGDDMIYIDSTSVRGESSFFMDRGCDNIRILGTSNLQKKLSVFGGKGSDAVEVVSGATVSSLEGSSISQQPIAPSLITFMITDPTIGAIAKADALAQTVTPTLTASVSTSSIVETAGAMAATLTVTRSGSTIAPVDVTLTSSDPTRATVPATATIPAGATSVTVNISAIDNSTIDPDATVTFTVAATHFRSATDTLVVTSEDVATLALATSLASVSETGGADAATLTVSRGGASDISQALVVSLVSSASARLSVPATVTIPATQSSVTFSASAINNQNQDGDVDVTVTATATAFTSATTIVHVIDDETAALTLTANASSIAENATGPGVDFTLTRLSADTSADLFVSLQSNNMSRLTVPASITIPTGQTSVHFFATPVNNISYDGNADVTIVATTPTSPTAQASPVTVIEDETQPPAALTLSITPSAVSENAAANSVTLAVFRENSDRTGELVVHLAASDTSRISVPATITIPAQQFSASITLSPIDNLAVDGPLDVTITASATGFPDKSSMLTINDNENAALAISLPATSVSENIGTTTATFSTSIVSSSDITVAVTYSSPVVTGPASVIIPAGQSSVQTMLNIAPGIVIDNSTIVKIQATATGATASSFDLTVNDTDALSLSTDISANTFVASNGTVITREPTFSISGQTVAGATVAADINGDGVFDEASTTAAPDGTYTLVTTLTHTTTNFGENRIVVKSMLGTDSSDALVSAHLAIGTVMRFTTNLGTWDTELLDVDAPVTVQNFLTYANSTAYDNLIVHRNVPGIIVQGGGYTVSGGIPSPVTTNAAIQGEFNAANSNIRGTMAMALPPNNPNGGTSQWFFSARDNSSLDSGQYTVFGRVIGTGMSVIDQINAVTPRDLRSLYGDTALDELPLNNVPPAGTSLIGTASVSTGSAIVTGTGTLFTSELQIGSSLLLDGEAFVVKSIESNTSLTITVATQFTLADFAFRKDVLPPNSDFIVFSDIGEILAQI